MVHDVTVRNFVYGLLTFSTYAKWHYMHTYGRIVEENCVATLVLVTSNDCRFLHLRPIATRLLSVTMTQPETDSDVNMGQFCTRQEIALLSTSIQHFRQTVWSLLQWLKKWQNASVCVCVCVCVCVEGGEGWGGDGYATK